MSKIIPDKFIQDNRDASPIDGIPMAQSITGSPADFTTPSSDDTAARKKEVDKNLKALSPKQSAEEPNANKDAAGRILKAILGNPESIAELKKILAAIKGPSTSLFSGWGEKGSSSSSADTNPRSRNTHPRGNDTGHSGDRASTDTESGDRASTDTESGDRASTDTESDDTVPHSNKSNISSTDAYKKMKTIKDMKLPEQITGLNRLLTSFEKPLVGANAGGAGMTDDDKNVLNMAILTFIREHAYDSILFKGLNDYDELYRTLNSILNGILIESFNKTKDQKKTKAQNKKNLEVATAQDDLNSAKEAIKVLMQKHKDEDIMEAKERVTELDAEKTNTEQQLAKATIAQTTDVGEPKSKITTPTSPPAPVPRSKQEQQKDKRARISDVADQKVKSLQQQNKKIDHGSKDSNKEVDTLTNKLLEIKQKLAQATTYVTTLEKDRTEKEKNTRASTTRGNREAELEQQYNKIKEANIILETAQQSPTAEEVTIAVDQADDDPTPEILIQNLLDILLEKTSPIYTPQYFELKKEFSYIEASNGNPAIYTDIKPYYKRVFMTRSMTHKQNPWKKTTDTVYYIMPSGPSGELGSLVRESTRGLPVVGSCAIQYVHPEVQDTTTTSGVIPENAIDDKPGQKLQELRAFICSRNNCNRGQMVSLPKDDPLIKSPVKGNEKRAFETLDSSMHQAEEENHAMSLEISTYLWELLWNLSGPKQKLVQITYKGNYIYYHENNNENNPTILKSRSYFCKPTPYKNYITLYDTSGEGLPPITNFLYGIDRNASKYGENNASITIDNNNLGLTASMEMFNSGTDSRTGEADEGVHVSSPLPVSRTNSTVGWNDSNPSLLSPLLLSPSGVVPNAAPQGNLQQHILEYPLHGGKKPEYEYDILKACILANLYTLILFINIKPLSNPIEALYNAFKDGHILGSEDKRDPILKTDPINTHITIPETTGLVIRKTTPITIKPIFNGYDNAKDWFEGCVKNSTLFNCIIYKGHTNYLPIESVIGKYSIYNNLEDRTKLFSNYPYDYRIEQYNKLYLTRYRAINKMGDLSRKSRHKLMTGTSGYTAQELRVIEQAVKDPSTRNNPLLYPDMYNLQKGVALTKDKTCKSNGTFRSNLYLIFGDKNGYVISQGGGGKKKTASNHKKYNKDKLYMKQLNKQRQTKPNKTNKRKKNAKKYTNKRQKIY